MSKITNRWARFAIGCAVGSLAPGLAMAQALPETGSEPAPDDDEIVVTGTLIRGADAVGSQTISLGADQFLTTGASDASKLLATVPQNTTFLDVPAVQGFANRLITVNRPNLRFLGSPTGGSSSTLLLLDGHRMVGMGVRQTAPDADAVAVGAIERVEVVTDGGSATYGSDAVGGVINYITRRRFDGVAVKGHYGFADDFYTWDTDVTVGTDWEWGSAYISYNYQENDQLFGRDRDYQRRFDYINNAPRDVQCASPNILFGATVYAFPSLTQGIGNRCDNGEDATLYPAVKRHSVFGSILLDEGGPFSAWIKTFYFKRRSLSDGGPLGATLTVPATSPFFVRPANQPTAMSETVLLNLSPVFGSSTPQRANNEAWGGTVNLRYAVSRDWQVNAMANLGSSTAEYKSRTINPAILPVATAQGLFNPFNLAAPGNAAFLATARDFFGGYGHSKQEQTNFRIIADGSLFALPGGDAKLAIGAEYLKEEIGANLGDGSQATIDTRRRIYARRRIVSAFGELNLPIIKTDGGLSLTLNASLRHDDYSDVGGTTNPKFAVEFAPFSWLKLRGNWGKSFTAPSLIDAPAINPASLVAVGRVVAVNPAVPPGPTQTQVFLTGVDPNLTYQTAETYSLGLDMNPPFIPGLSVNATYYHIDFDDQIGITPSASNPSLFYSQFTGFYAQNFGAAATPAQQAAFLQAITDYANLANNPATLTTLPPANIYNIIDGRTRNLARIITSGIDFNVRYRTDTSFGSVFAGIAGTYLLTYKQGAFAGAPIIETVRLEPRLRSTVNLGAEIGDFTASATWSRQSSIPVTPTAANAQQSRIDDFNIINLYFNYDFTGEGLFKDLSVSLNVDNVFDQDPPLYRGQYRNGFEGFSNGFTLGRLVKFGIAKKF